MSTHTAGTTKDLEKHLSSAHDILNDHLEKYSAEEGGPEEAMEDSEQMMSKIEKCQYVPVNGQYQN